MSHSSLHSQGLARDSATLNLLKSCAPKICSEAGVLASRTVGASEAGSVSLLFGQRDRWEQGEVRRSLFVISVPSTIGISLAVPWILNL